MILLLKEDRIMGNNDNDSVKGVPQNPSGTPDEGKPADNPADA